MCCGWFFLKFWVVVVVNIDLFCILVVIFVCSGLVVLDWFV